MQAENIFTCFKIDTLIINRVYYKVGQLQYYLVDPVVDRVGRNDRLGCFVDQLHRLVDDFTTRLDLADFRSTCGHFDHNLLLMLAHWQLTRKILCPSTCRPSHSQFQVEGLAFLFSFHPLIFS